MPLDDLYWNSIDFGSDESVTHDDPPSKHHYVDPWDLENYAYIREHLDSVDLSSDPSSSSGEFAEANSTSFYYVPGQKEQNYAAIDEVRHTKDWSRRRQVCSDSGLPSIPHRDDVFDSDFEENPYEENLKDSSLFYVHDVKEDRWRKVMPSSAGRDRSLSFSYGDYGYDPYGCNKNEIYSRLDEDVKKDSTLPIYDDVRSSRRKPRNFGLSNYGHLKIDYSYSWNNLDKYIGN